MIATLISLIRKASLTKCHMVLKKVKEHAMLEKENSRWRE